MFLSELNYQQRKIFLNLAKEILVADDGVVDYQEEKYLRALCAEMSLSFHDELVVKKSELDNYFDKIEIKKIVLIELVGLSFSNQNYHKNQELYIKNICDIFGVSSDMLKNIEELLKQYQNIQNKIIEFVGE